MPPLIGKNLFYLLAKLPQNGLSSRVAPIPWVLSGRPSSYYLITNTHLRYIPLVDGLSYPVKLVDEKLVPADAAYSKSQLESSQIKAEEKRRATRAGEQVADADMRENLRVEVELDELLVETNGTVLRPDGRAWGVLVEEGESQTFY
ncbi:hypothetical protein BDY24DRAFT_398254 [Mrakia frigida]|uniref:uncharacterized protein n=1 Tax=Mrakia frigida TaxID=29902 RepID=UPI003FCC0914